MKQAKVIGLAACAVAALGGWYLLKDDSPKGTLFHSAGGRWMATDVDWTQINGGWRIGALLYPYRVESSVLSRKTILKQLCESVVTVRPEAPETGIAADDIFRIDLNIALPDAETGEYAPRFAHQLPLPVQDRACDVGPSERIYFPTYPGELQGWELQAALLEDQDDGTVTRVVTFELKDDHEARTRDFPFGAACDAVTRDPFIGLTPEGQKIVDGTGFIPDGPLKIVAQKTNKFVGIVRTFVSNSLTFEIALGSCHTTKAMDT